MQKGTMVKVTCSYTLRIWPTPSVQTVGFGKMYLYIKNAHRQQTWAYIFNPSIWGGGWS